MADNPWLSGGSTGGGGGGNPWVGGSTSASSGGGASFGHFVNRTASLIAHTPAGVITYAGALARAVDQPLAKLDVALGAASPAERRRAEGSGVKTFVSLNKELAKGTAEVVAHPLRDPASTALILPSLLAGGYGLAARGGTAAAGIARAGTISEAGRAAGVALFKPSPLIPRIVRIEGEPAVIGAYSRGAAFRHSQILLDQARQTFPDTPILGRSLRSKVGFQLARRRHYEEVVARVPGLELLRAQRKLTLPEHTALRVVAEGVPIETRIATHVADLAHAESRNTKLLLRRQIKLLTLAKPLVHEIEDPVRGVVPALKDAKLQTVYDTLKNTAASREDLLNSFDLLTRDAGARVHAPGRVFLGAEFLSRGQAAKVLRQVNSALGRLQKGKGRIVREARYAGMSDLRAATAEARKVSAEAARSSAYRGKLAAAADKVESARAEAHGLGAQVEQVMGGTIDTHTLTDLGFKVGPGSDLAAMRIKALGTLYDRLGPAFTRYEKALTAEYAHERQLMAGIALAERQAKGAAEISRLREQRITLLRAQRAKFHDLLDTQSQLLELQQMIQEGAGGLVGAEGFRGGDVYVGYGALKPSVGLLRFGDRIIGNPRKPASIRTQFTGAAIHGGVFRSEAAQVVAHAQIEAARFTMLLRNREYFRRFATPEKVRPGQIPMRLDEIAGQSVTPAAKMLMQEAQSGKPLTDLEKQGLAVVYDSLRNMVFPSEAEALNVPGIVWIDEKLLGGLNKPNPLAMVAAHTAGRRAIGLIDFINNASRLAVLYLKPAYLIPNLAGNLALTIIQQGFAAPGNLARAARINGELSNKATATLDALIGEGASRAIAAQGGPLAGISQGFANVANRLVDLVPRRAAFLHEAERAGFKTTAEVERLLTDEGLRDRLVTAAQEANSEMVDFNRLGPFEREIVRRVIFFYPWVKGSTVYGARLIGEHPGTFAAMGALGQLGQQTADTLGPRPSYAQGIVPVGTRGALDLVLQPASASLLGSPAQIAQTAAGLLSGKPGSAFQALGFATPAAGALAALTTGVNSFGQQNPGGVSNARLALEELYSGLPQVTLAQRLLNPPSEHPDRVYPYTREDALLQFLVGGLAPRPYNRTAGQKAAAAGR